MDFLLDNIQFVIIVVLALASWLKARSESKQSEADERRAREEMTEEDSPFGQDAPWELPKTERQPSVPPPVRREANVPPPLRPTLDSALPRPPAPADPVLVEALKIDPYEQEDVLKRQRALQERFEKVQEEKSHGRRGVRAMRDSGLKKQRKQQPSKPFASIKATLNDSRQTRRAIVLREVLGPPLALR